MRRGFAPRARAAAWYRGRPADGRLRRTTRAVARAIRRLERAPGPWYDLQVNGEAALLSALAGTLDAEVVLDVGANTGEWYQVARRAFPTARMVLVEIAPPLWPGLEQLVAADPAAELARHGLSESDGVVTLRWYPDNPALSTTTTFPHGARYDEVEAEVRSAAGFLADRGIERIDVAKVDVEGAELPVVAALEPLMGARRVGLVQFEYGRANVLTRALLHDYAAIAQRTGYRLGRLGPSGVDFTPYTLEDEDFRPRNMVLCRPDVVPVVTRFP